LFRRCVTDIADIPILGRHFLNDSAPNNGKKDPELSVNALEILTARYPWAGNVRRMRKPRRAPVIVLPASAYRAASPPARTFPAAYPSLHQPYGTLHEGAQRFTNANLFCAAPGKSLEHEATAGALGLERSHLYRQNEIARNTRPRTKFMTTPAAKPQPNHRAGFVAIVGRPNAGKFDSS